MRDLEKENQKNIEIIAENWLKENPITQPLEDYFKKVFVAAYNSGIYIGSVCNIDNWEPIKKTNKVIEECPYLCRRFQIRKYK